MMAGIRAKSTKPELQIRKRLYALGYRYRLHPVNIPGRPDVALTRHQTAIFVHGCFWHGHDCSLFKLPDTRREFWLNKIAQNQLRDHIVQTELGGGGWRSLTIWECAIRGPGRIGLEATVERTIRWLDSGEATGEIRGTR
jgi:DNA mismatch endonuclease (patch repair protein)